MNDFVVFVGNGVNNLKNDYKWENLIEDIIQHIGATGQINTNGKPFPLLYEEIWVKAIREDRSTEDELKEFIAHKVKKFIPNEIHHQLIKSGVTDIITTNYDHTLEEAEGIESEKIINEGMIKESKYSLFRYNKVNNSQIWHIHGDLNLPNSILLGYEQYSGYLQHMRNYVEGNTGTSYKKYKFKNIRDRIKNHELTHDSWIDFFFSHNVHIIGASLDFVEIDIWWLLTYRARQVFKSKLPISNQIYYYYPSSWAKKIKNKLDLLNSTNVRPYSIEYDENDKIKYYRKALNIILQKEH